MPTVLPTYVQLPGETGESALAINHRQNLLGKLVRPLDDDHLAGLVPSNNLFCQFLSTLQDNSRGGTLVGPLHCVSDLRSRSSTIRRLTINCGKSARFEVCCAHAHPEPQISLSGMRRCVTRHSLIQLCQERGLLAVRFLVVLALLGHSDGRRQRLLQRRVAVRIDLSHLLGYRVQQR